AFGAQLVEHGAVGRRLIEEAGVNIPKRAERRVVEGELAVGCKNGDAVGDLVQHAPVRLRHVRELRAQRFGLADVDGDAGAAFAARRVHYVEVPALPGDDGVRASGKDLAAGIGARELVARRAAQQL